MSLWFDSENHNKGFYLGNKLKPIDKLLKNVQVPYLVDYLEK